MSTLFHFSRKSFAEGISAFLVVLIIGGDSKADDAEYRAVTFINKVGGIIHRNKKISGQPIVTVDLYNTPVTDDGIKALTGLPGLKGLNLSYTKITDEGMKELASLGNLQTLSLVGTSVTEKGLRELTKLKNLRELYLGSKFSKQAIAEVKKGLPNCKVIQSQPGSP